MEPIDDLLEQHEKAHGSLCPGTLLALRMAVLGCALLGIEDPRGADRNKLVVWVEIDRWLADAVEAVTGARLGKRTLKFLDYGKLAATFLNVETEEVLCAVVTIEVHLRENDAPGHPRSRVTCRKCGEEVNDGREVNAEDGSKLCRPCAFDALSRDHQGPVNVAVNDFYSIDLCQRPTAFV
jgi:formylmethanofuran dehydrogenase subunit E